jgi:hypothetical protein
VRPGHRTARAVALVPVRECLTACGRKDLIENAEEVISELATNASAPRGALSYPRRSREELEGGFWV